MHGHHKCGHHWLAKLLILLAWVSALGFWIVAFSDKTIVWGMDAQQLFSNVVIFAILAFSTKFCGCYGGSKMTDSKSCNCACGSCEGGKCKGGHGDGHQHM